MVASPPSRLEIDYVTPLTRRAEPETLDRGLSLTLFLDLLYRGCLMAIPFLFG